MYYENLKIFITFINYIKLINFYIFEFNFHLSLLYLLNVIILFFTSIITLRMEFIRQLELLVKILSESVINLLLKL